MTKDQALQKGFEIGRQTMHEEASELYNAVINTPIGAVVEIGSASGGTTFVLCEAALLVDKKVISVDPYPEEYEGTKDHYTPGLMKEFKESFRKNILDKYDNVIQYEKNLPDIIDLMPSSISVVFIDGCHDISFVKREVELLLPKIVRKGVLYIHDINWSVGQFSGSTDDGVNKILETIKGGKVIGSMLKIVIKNDSK